MPMQPKNLGKNPGKSSGLQRVLERNDFYRDNYKRSVVLCALMIAVNIVLGGMIFYKATHPPKPQYFATTDDGRMIRLYALSDPEVSKDYVLQWATEVAQKAYALDWVHWQTQLQDVSNKFTPSGWQDYVSKLKASNNLTTLQTYKMVSSATVTGAPQIIQQGVVNGRYMWKVQFPVLVNFQSSAKTIPQTLMLTLNIVRMYVVDNPDRIAIDSFIADTQQVTATGNVSANQGLGI